MYTCKAAQRDTTTHEKMFFTEDIFSLGPAAGVVRRFLFHIYFSAPCFDARKT